MNKMCISFCELLMFMFCSAMISLVISFKMIVGDGIPNLFILKYMMLPAIISTFIISLIVLIILELSKNIKKECEKK